MLKPMSISSITPSSLWAQACEALAQDRYDLAQQLLERHLSQPQLRGPLTLYLLSVLSLYAPGDSPEEHLGLHEEMLSGLQEALEAAPELRDSPLYLALNAEAQARALGAQAPAPPEEARYALGEDGALARYHALCALCLAGRYEEIDAMSPAARDLPVHLRWRLRQWQARSEEARGNLSEAAKLYAEAAHLSTGRQRAAMLQEEAALHLQGGQDALAEQCLRQARAAYPPLFQEEDQLMLATWHYLQAQLLLSRDQLGEALSHIEEAANLEQRYGDPSYGVALVWGQILSAQGQSEAALTHFQNALKRASVHDQPYAQHELGVALLDLDRPLEARDALQETLRAPNYPFAAEALADLAESAYRLGHLQEAQQEAQSALKQGATVPASLVLGGVELEYYHLSEALEHYQRVTREAPHASRDWLLGHQMAADILAQQGFPDASAAYAHAQQALEHTDPSDEWYVTLEEHLRRAESLMGRSRTLN